MTRPNGAAADPAPATTALAADDHRGDVEGSLLDEYREALDSGTDDADRSAAGPDGPSGTPEREWAWVTRWRQEKEPTPWGPGLVLTTFTAVLVAIAIVVLTQGLADLLLLAVLINIVVAAGLAPAIWMVRDIPVIRWIGAGMALGLVAGWCAALAVIPAPV